MIQGISYENLKLMATEKQESEEYVEKISSCTDAYTVVGNEEELIERTEPLG